MSPAYWAFPVALSAASMRSAGLPTIMYSLGGLTGGRAELLDRPRAECPHVPRTEGGVAHDHIHPVEGHIELLGEDLGKGRLGALAHFDFARKPGHFSVLRDPEVGIEVGGIFPTAGPLLRFKPVRGLADSEKHEHAAAGQLHELPALHLRAPFFIS